MAKSLPPYCYAPVDFRTQFACTGVINLPKYRYSSTPSRISSYSHFHMRYIYDDIRLHVARSYTSSPDSPFSLISSLTLSNHLLLGSLDFPLYMYFHLHCCAPLALLITCPYHFNLLSWTFFMISPTFIVPHSFIPYLVQPRNSAHPA